MGKLRTQYIKDTRTIEESFWEHVWKVGGCWLWMKSCNHQGYGRLPFRGRQESAHRVAWILKNGDIPEGMLVLHKCDATSCINPDHLFLGTASDNTSDCMKKGRMPRPKIPARQRKTYEEEFVDTYLEYCR